MHPQDFLNVPIFVLLLQATPTEAASNTDICPINCHHGYCAVSSDTAVCQCEPNWDGDDCTLPFKTCPDGKRTCFNGSECLRSNSLDETTGKYKYRCDCTKAYGVDPFAGHQCEHSATEICEKDGTSRHAFCVNDGKCRAYVEGREEHVGCFCPEEFEGIHCQYRLGTAPEGEEATSRGSSGGSGGGSLGAVAVVFIVLISLGVVGAFGYMIYRKRNMKESGFVDESDLPPVVSAEEEVDGADGGKAGQMHSVKGAGSDPVGEDFAVVGKDGTEGEII